MLDEDNADIVQAAIYYIADPPSSDPSRDLEYYKTDTDKTTMRIEPHEMCIRNARPAADQIDLDREGFHLTAYPTAITNYRDEADIVKHLPGEMAAMICGMTGATAAISMGWQLRFGEASGEHPKLFNSLPARFAHGDFTDESFQMLVSTLPGLERSLYSRFAIYNVWRVITPPPQDVPLAVCDDRSSSIDDWVPVTAVMDAPGKTPFRSLTTIFRPNPKHRWYYFKDMTPDEVLIFKGADTDKTRSQRVAHTAFTDPTCPPGTMPRGSIEARVIAAFK